MEIVSRVHANNLVKWAKNKKDVVVLSADLTSSTEIDLFRDTYKDRFFSMGISEQNMLSFAGGMAREGFKPFVHTFAVFIYRRALDQIAMSIAYPNLPVKMFGFLPGVTTPGGASHQAIEDIAVMRALPNMTVIECGDATEIETMLDPLYEIDGPVYIRMLRGEVPRLFSKDEPFQIGKPRVLKLGTDICVISTGICTEEAMRTIKVLEKRGLSFTHLHISTLKPFLEKEVLGYINSAKYGVITIENHSVIGGLCSIISEVITDNGLSTKLKRMGINDTFLHGASRQYLMREYKIDSLELINRVEELTGNKFDIDIEELDKVYIAPVHSDAKAEAL
jgi:transketolase